MKEIIYSICKPLKGVTKNYWISLNTKSEHGATSTIVAYIHPSSIGRSTRKKELDEILNHMWSGK